MRASTTGPLIALAGLLLFPALTACVPVDTREATNVQPSATATASLSHRMPLTLGPEPEPWIPSNPTWEGLPSRPVGPAEYAATYLGDVVDVSMDTILDFYQSAAVAFPFPLPERYAFPVDPARTASRAPTSTPRKRSPPSRSGSTSNTPTPRPLGWHSRPKTLPPRLGTST